MTGAHTANAMGPLFMATSWHFLPPPIASPFPNVCPYVRAFQNHALISVPPHRPPHPGRCPRLFFVKYVAGVIQNLKPDTQVDRRIRPVCVNHGDQDETAIR